ncbi:MAG: bifunctional (p)ppGpp synthetase/guanosine-3',5'-bis(diphosphate) 3'-pyrophosphohydrolase, partial [Clostridia bacterium]|nr:bifunctional (p)ppGpp synthetase/guanosine-3',5'-bis(diphosphate) 3'-pyrophosphohydrolase [Clostridia bacterium]
MIAELKARVTENAKAYDADAIDRAVEYAVRYHDGQFRSSGEEYVCHPLQVCLILMDLGMDTPTLQAALLHDVVEDTDSTLEDLTREFGDEVALLVDGVTKLDKLPFSTREEQQAENVRKMLLALSKDVRVIIIKLADRLHNMRTIHAMPEQKRRDKAKETMDIYAPLAHRLGMRNIKDELEELSLQVLDPVAYAEIEQELNTQREQHQNFLEEVQARITKRLQDYGMHPTVSGRMTSIVSTYRKTYMQGRTLGEIYDIYAVRIIVDEVNDCYYALGIVHELYRPIPGRVKDYISTPKPNMYQSLHTTLMSPTGTPFEVQIRTWSMHYTAEYGIAAHWKYKVGLSGEDKLDDRLAWVRQFIESQKDVDDAEEIVRTIKTDLSSEDIFVLTPKGDVISLPSGSTVIDFAYAIHSAIGNRMVGAKVGGR